MKTQVLSDGRRGSPVRGGALLHIGPGHAPYDVTAPRLRQLQALR